MSYLYALKIMREKEIMLLTKNVDIFKRVSSKANPQEAWHPPNSYFVQVGLGYLSQSANNQGQLVRVVDLMRTL